MAQGSSEPRTNTEDPALRDIRRSFPGESDERLTRWLDLKEQIEDLYSRIPSLPISDAETQEKILHELKLARHRLDEKRPYTISVIGPTGSGKSALLNSEKNIKKFQEFINEEFDLDKRLDSIIHIIDRAEVEAIIEGANKEDLVDVELTDVPGSRVSIERHGSMLREQLDPENTDAIVLVVAQGERFQQDVEELVPIIENVIMGEMKGEERLSAAERIFLMVDEGDVRYNEQQREEDINRLTERICPGFSRKYENNIFRVMAQPALITQLLLEYPEEGDKWLQDQQPAPHFEPSALNAEKGGRATAPVPTKSTDDLAAALAGCREAARVGYRIAKGNLAESAKAIDEVSISLSRHLKSLEDGGVGTPMNIEKLKQRLSGVIRELKQLRRAAERDLEERRKRLDRFSVTLFGRTMAGKSTLMEILTHGDGGSIGNGAQRTTRDVRSYSWKGLEVTDVPGVAAFDGAEDEELAFREAEQADLVLFLITDDAPQPVEAECFARLRRLDKPVLGICNVKIAVDDEDDRKLFLGNPGKKFDRNRLDQLVQQFHAFADQHIPGNHVPFIFTHLGSRFLADRPQFSEHRDRLLHASRFDEVESRIISEVVSRGPFLRLKSFIDATMDPMIQSIVTLLHSSAQNSTDVNVLIGKQRQFTQWKKNFQTGGQERINNFVSKEMEELRKQVPLFAEDHYEDRSASEEWKRLVERREITRKAQKLQEELNNKCKQALSEFSRELRSELSLVGKLAEDRRITMDSIFDSKRAWKWATTVLSGGLAAAAIFVSGPLGWAAAAVSGVGWLTSFFFDDREEKASRARDKLTKWLHAEIDRMEQDLSQQLDRWFHKELLDKRVQVPQDDFTAVMTVLSELAGAQRTLAWILNDLQKRRGRTLVDEALRQLQEADTVGDGIRDVAKVPGYAIMLLIEPHAVFPENVLADLERLLEEKILFVRDTKDKLSILAQAIGQNCDRDKIRIEEKVQVAHVELDDLDRDTEYRVCLAQQLSGLHVMRQSM